MRVTCSAFLVPSYNRVSTFGTLREGVCVDEDGRVADVVWSERTSKRAAVACNSIVGSCVTFFACDPKAISTVDAD
jgi:hypothetical protein